MIVIFLDDSGEAAEPYVTLAGYMGTRDEWEKFEEEARAHLDAHGIEYLHTVDMHRRRGQFEGWTRDQVRNFATGLFAILGNRVPVGLAFSVFKEVYDAKRVNLKREGAATTFCLKGLITRIVNQPGVERAFEMDGVDISIVLEKGNRHEDAMLKEFARIAVLDDRFKSIEAADKKAYISLQVSDFLAYFTRRLLCMDKEHPRYSDEEKFFDEIIKGVAVHNRFVATDFHGHEPDESEE